jgi:hypothetical protein
MRIASVDHLDLIGRTKAARTGCAVQLQLRVERGGRESTPDLRIFRVAYRPGNTLFNHSKLHGTLLSYLCSIDENLLVT